MEIRKEGRCEGKKTGKKTGKRDGGGGRRQIASRENRKEAGSKV